MFTLLVSWLLVACIPGLLMLATLGLGRLEKEFAHDSVTANDVAEFLEHAEAVDVQKLAREGMPEALDCLHRRQAQRLLDSPRPASRAVAHHAAPFFAADIGDHGEDGLPTRIHADSRVNPQFNGTRHVNPV
jgi:hypothetical protein